MATANDKKLAAHLHQAYRHRMPSAAAIAENAVRKCTSGRENDPAWIRENFSTLVESVQVAAHQEYLEAQQRAAREAFAEVLLPVVGEKGTAADFVKVLGDNFFGFDEFFLALTQGRRPHSGKAFELLVTRLIALHCPFAAAAMVPGQPDFVLPSMEQLRWHPMECMILTIKKSLGRCRQCAAPSATMKAEMPTIRHRWQQLLPEGVNPLARFILTSDEDLTPEDLIEMREARIAIVVPAQLKGTRQHYTGANNVIPFETFFRNHLDPAIERWRAADMIREAYDGEVPGFRDYGAEVRPSVFAQTRAAFRRAILIQQASLFDH